MALQIWKYTAACAIILTFGCLIYFSEFSSMVFELPRHLKRFDSYTYFVKSYKFSDGSLEMKGFYSTGNYTHDASLKLEGLEILLNDFKPEIINDPKLEKAVLPYPKYFMHDRTVSDVNCRAIINGDQAETRLASNLSTQPRQFKISTTDFTNMTKNCQDFKENRGYIMSPLSKLEADFPIAFSILMYKDTEQTERLLRAIYRPQHIYCIHVDKKSRNDIFQAMAGIANCFENVFLLNPRIDVRWGQYTNLEPELLCMEELLSRNRKWKYFINLTGQEFPLRTNYELVRILMTYNGANDVVGIVKRAPKDRWSHLPPPPHNLTATKGAVHIIVNREFVDFALHNQKAKDLLEWVKKVRHPDECFFNTLNHNPILRIRGAYMVCLPQLRFGDAGPFDNNFVLSNRIFNYSRLSAVVGIVGMEGHVICSPETDNTSIKPFMGRFKNWGSWPCHGRRVRAICNFGVGDLPLLSTRRELFANKFDWHIERYARDCMEELLFNRTRDEYLGKMSFDSRFYADLGFVKNKVD